MGDVKLISTPLATNFHLSKDQSPQTKEEREFIAKVPYAIFIGSLMNVFVITRPNIGHEMEVVSMFMSNLGKTHWEVFKWILRYVRSILEKFFHFSKRELKIQGYIDTNFGGEVDH